MLVLALGAVMEMIWVAYLSLRLPRHYEANHWNLAWIGLDSAQIVLLLLTSWAAWRRRALLIWYSLACGILLLVDAWFDVTTARYSDLGQSLASLTIELPSALFLLWISQHTARRLTGEWLKDTDLAIIPTRHLTIPHRAQTLSHANKK